MFGKESKKTGENKVAERNIIGKNTKITGEIISEGDFRIDGTLEGTIETNGRVIIGNTGLIKGKVECTNADVEGEFSGELFVSNTLTVKSSANITGDVVIGKLSVEPGAEFNATCAMKGAVKELNKNEQGLKEKTA
ncbi:bactofilin family protein [Tenacibaculum singaporense]|uniref:Polymer-forming cytoskeletal protein n=1 Tax=Tenacibaculum singaporense TaxID=2358479 RepID=A0A3Q8RSF5_9FLAO|nr:polymer-forming cytoskeletal protein [Tenacibaculum singaporense]AZJ34594.1 polymer-forming cytoskeletal protein [Tenacibaculum singaporense]RSC95084.1 polymer-forming cytoskeletal protein [Tenacibaculum singaporense]